MAATLIASGLDINRSILFLQSSVIFMKLIKVP